MIRYQIRITDDRGVALAIPRDFNSCRYSLRGDGRLGMCELVLPRLRYQSIMNEANPDYRIQIWRSINAGGTYRLDGRTEFFALKWDKTDDSIVVTGPSIQHLLTRRIDAYYAGYKSVTGGSQYTGQVTTIMYQIMNKNFGAGVTDVNRDVSGSQYIIGNLLINTKAGAGPLLQVGCSRENVYDTLIKFSEASWDAGTWAAGVISSNGSNQFVFDAYVDYSGVDRRTSLVLSPEARNIQNATLTIDSIEEKTSVIAAGRGTGQGRYIAIAQDAALIGKSLYGYKEMFAEDTNARNADIIDVARSKLRERRPVISLTCDITQDRGTIRGVHYDVGDYLRVNYQGGIYDMRLDLVEVSIDASGVSESVRLST